MLEKISAKSTLLVFFLTLCISCFSAASDETGSSFISQLIGEVRDCSNRDVSLSRHKEVAGILEELEKKQAYIEQGSDDLRVKFVALQASVEEVLTLGLQEGRIKRLVGVIHTPTPTTPLCSPVDDVDETLLSPTIRKDAEKLRTVGNRAQILRSYLESGGRLYVVYPRSGLSKRTAPQLRIYFEVRRRFPQGLIDCPLNAGKIDEDAIGAFYLFEDASGEIYAFSIKSKQSNAPSVFSEWGIWLGSIKDRVVQERLQYIHHYLHSIRGPNLNREFEICNSPIVPLPER